MAERIRDRIKHAWNALTSRDPTSQYRYYGESSSTRPDRAKLSRGNEKTIVTSIYNRISLDFAMMRIEHVRLDEEGRYVETIKSGLNECLTLEANLDQTAFAFKQDIAISTMNEGCIAVVPVDTTLDPEKTKGFDVNSMRTGKITQWYPQHVKVELYNEKTGRHEEVVLPKSTVAIIENPFYAVMNAPNSTLQRLVRKLSMLDAIDEHNSSGKLDILIQLPYTIKTDMRRQQAEKRRKDIEEQLTGSKYGIAYIDGTERVTQLNRAVENNLLKQIEYLTSMLFSQLNMTQGILDGTADEQTMINYNNRTIKPFLIATVDETKRKFLSKTARSQGQSIKFFRNIFELASLKTIAESADTFCRNEITSKNEIRQEIGFKPSDDPKADQLINSNISHPESTKLPEGKQSVPSETQSEQVTEQN